MKSFRLIRWLGWTILIGWPLMELGYVGLLPRGFGAIFAPVFLLAVLRDLIIGIGLGGALIVLGDIDEKLSRGRD